MFLTSQWCQYIMSDGNVFRHQRMPWSELKFGNRKVCKKKKLSWMFGATWKIRPLGSLFGITWQSQERCKYSCLPDGNFCATGPCQKMSTNTRRQKTTRAERHFRMPFYVLLSFSTKCCHVNLTDKSRTVNFLTENLNILAQNWQNDAIFKV